MLDKSIPYVGTWTPIDLNDDVPGSGTTGAILHFRPSTTAAYFHSARKKGISEDKYLGAHLHTHYPTALSALNVCEAKIANLNEKTFVVGYFKAPASPTKNQKRIPIDDQYPLGCDSRQAWGLTSTRVSMSPIPSTTPTMCTPPADNADEHAISPFTVPSGATINSVTVRLRAMSTLGAVDDWIDGTSQRLEFRSSGGSSSRRLMPGMTFTWALDPDTGLAWTRTGVNAIANDRLLCDVRQPRWEPDFRLRR